MCLALEADCEGTALSSWCHTFEAASAGTADNRRHHHLSYLLVRNRIKMSHAPCNVPGSLYMV